jgi:hypothetical protein
MNRFPFYRQYDATDCGIASFHCCPAAEITACRTATIC